MSHPLDAPWTFDRVRAIHKNFTAEAGPGTGRVDLSEEQAIKRAIDMLKEATGHDPESIEVLGFRRGCLVPKPKERP